MEESTTHIKNTVDHAGQYGIHFGIQPCDHTKPRKQSYNVAILTLYKGLFTAKINVTEGLSTQLLFSFRGPPYPETWLVSHSLLLLSAIIVTNNEVQKMPGPLSKRKLTVIH